MCHHGRSRQPALTRAASCQESERELGRGHLPRAVGCRVHQYPKLEHDLSECLGFLTFRDPGHIRNTWERPGWKRTWHFGNSLQKWRSGGRQVSANAWFSKARTTERLPWNLGTRQQVKYVWALSADSMLLPISLMLLQNGNKTNVTPTYQPNGTG